MIELMSVKKEEAFAFYSYLIKDFENKKWLYKKYEFTLPGLISSKDWELFTAILINDKKINRGSDFPTAEAKSDRINGDFEYQYARVSGLNKLEEEQNVDHIFISYDNDYKDLEVRLVSKNKIKDIIASWRDFVLETYYTEKPKLRCRRRISYKYVEKNGLMLMEIKNKELIG